MSDAITLEHYLEEVSVVVKNKPGVRPQYAHTRISVNPSFDVYEIQQYTEFYDDGYAGAQERRSFFVSKEALIHPLEELMAGGSARIHVRAVHAYEESRYDHTYDQDDNLRFEIVLGTLQGEIKITDRKLDVSCLEFTGGDSKETFEGLGLGITDRNRIDGAQSSYIGGLKALGPL